MSCTSGCGSLKRGRASSLSAPPRRRLACRAPSAKGFGEGEGTIPWIDYTTAMVKHYYFYCVDEDFGAFFIKFCSTFPTRASSASTDTSISRGSWPGAASNSKRSTTGSCAVGMRCSASPRVSMKRRSRDFSANGSQYCRTPIQRQTERPAFVIGFRCCRAEFSLTEIWDCPLHGKGNFSRKSSGENIDLGRPETVQSVSSRAKCANRL